jgi:hypothetical protein
VVPCYIFGHEGSEVISFVLVLFQHHFEERVEGLILPLVAYPLAALVLHEVRMRFLTRFIDEIGSFLQAELAH